MELLEMKNIKGSGEIISCYILEEYQHHHLGRKW